ncbi:molybdopterin-dependent oxidoreductase [Ascidiaceihabitans sp.]|uniref:molybdopterin-dependent oxidoreductase n=1 Tax=Ascidiaceihabitans sp. TaxID=1872644 RepID=UPI00329A44E1
MQRHYRTCNICEAMCGLVIEHEGDQVLSIKPHKEDPLSRGHICPKAVALQDFRTDPDRVTTPLRKRGHEWEPVDWDEAIDYAAHGIRAVQDVHGKDGFGAYLGNPNAHKFANLMTLPRLIKAIGTTQRYSSATSDQIPHHVASIHMLGHPMLMPIPDLDRTDYLLVIGGNPMVSNGSMMTAPDFPGRIDDLYARGGRMVVIDPRRTETARHGAEHHFIRPETDAFLILALIHEVFAQNAVDLGALRDVIDGVEALRDAVQPFTPDLVARHTGIDAATIRNLAADFTGAERAVCYARMGASTQSYGGLCQWATNALNIITGNFDAVGGAMFTTPAFDNVGLTRRKGAPRTYPEKRSRVSGLPLYNGEFPSAVLAEEMETPGAGQIKGMITVAGNPVLTAPNGRRIESALKALDFMVSVDIHINDTTQHADLILPGTVALEEPVYDTVFHSFAVRNTANYADALFDRPKGMIPEWEIFARLGNALTGGRDLGPSPSEQLDHALSRGFHAQAVSVDVLKDHEGSLDLGPLVPCLAQRLQTPDGRLNLCPDVFVADLPRLLAHETPTDRPYVMIGRRQVRSHNSWTQNAPRLVKGRNRCTVQINPQDAGDLGIADGAQVRVASRVGHIVVPAEVTDDMAPGVVSIPQGWGQGGGQLSAATQTLTASINDLTDDKRVDVLTGNAAFNGLPVSLTPVEMPSAQTAAE